MIRGVIKYEHTAWCGLCGHWERVSTRLRRDAERVLRSRGWQCKASTGWTCPKCVDSKYVPK